MSDSGSDTSVETVKSRGKRRKKINYFEKEVEDIVKSIMANQNPNFIGQIEFFSAGDNFNHYIERMENILKIN